MGELEGRTAIVTGAGGGIGAGIARVLAREGARLLLTDLNDASVQAVAREIDAEGGRVTSAAHDAASWESGVAVLALAIERLGHVDLLVNCAGVAKATAFAELSIEEWDAIQSVNARGTFIMCRLAATHMIGRQSGNIVNIGSVAGRDVSPNWIAYGASKFAVTGLSMGLARELGPHGINVNVVNPGAVKTHMWTSEVQGGSPMDIDEYAKTLPLGRAQTPEDIGEAVSFLASDRARNVTGQFINVDSGAMVH